MLTKAAVAVGAGVLVWAACSDSVTGLETVDLNGIWGMNYSATDGEFTCAMHGITLVFDSTAANPQLMTGGTGHCVGRGRNDSLFQASSSIDSVAVGGGRISFQVFSGSYRFAGRIVSEDSLAGTMTQDGSYVQIGPYHLVGTWSAQGLPPPP